jgi:hypothetical protein
MDSVEIRWPNGAIETLQNVPADAIHTIVEGSGIRDSKPLPAPGTVARSPSGFPPLGQSICRHKMLPKNPSQPHGGCPALGL